MTKDTGDLALFVLRALQLVVMDHGDKFSFSMSQASRVWLTLSHWGDGNWTTSVELDPMDDEHAFLPALAVLIHTHSLKCFHGSARVNSWLAVEPCRASASLSGAWLRGHPGLKGAAQEEAPPASAEARQENSTALT